MSLQAVLWAMDLEIPPTEKMLLMVIGSYADVEGYCYPGQATLVRQTSMSERTIRSLLRKLEDRGLVSTERRTSETGVRKTNGYQLHKLPAISAGGGPTGKIGTPYRQTVAGIEEPLEEPLDQEKKRATRITRNWEPNEKLLEWAKDSAVGIDIKHETEMFVDYWISIPGMRGAKLDWDATWRNWMRRATPTMKPNLRAVVGGQATLPAAPTYPTAKFDDGFEPAFPEPRW